MKFLRGLRIGLAVMSALDTLLAAGAKPGPREVMRAAREVVLAVEAATGLDIPDEMVQRMANAALNEYQAWQAEHQAVLAG